MVQIGVKLDKRKRKKDGTFPLKISVHRNGKTLYIPLNISLHEDEWNAKKEEIVKRADRRSLNILVADKLSDVNMRLLRLQSEGKSRSLTNLEFIRVISGEDNSNKPHYFSEALDNYISLIQNNGTKRLYLATEKKLRLFCGSKYKELTFEEMTPSWLKHFDKELAETSPSANARSIHLRNIRAVFNAALDDGIINCYPFRRYEIKSQHTAKLALTAEELARIYTHDSSRYIDIFFLSFFLIGINMVDMAKLSSIDNGRIVYDRTKTHKMYSIKVEPEALDILKRYEGKNKLISIFEELGSYRNLVTRQGYYFRKLEKELSIKHICYYSARHSWATIAAELDISDEVISMALGHTKINVTETYIKRNREKIDAANRKVIDFLLKHVKKEKKS